MAKILVVDDDPDFVNLTRRILQRKGYEVVTAASGQQALAVMRKEKPDLVLLDIMMSYILDGLDVSREMAQDPALKDVPVIMVTSLTGARAEAAQLSGEYVPVDEWIHKPIDPDTCGADKGGAERGEGGRRVSWRGDRAGGPKEARVSPFWVKGGASGRQRPAPAPPTRKTRRRKSTPAAPPHLRLHRDAPPMRFQNLLDQREPQPGPTRGNLFGLGGAVELLKDAPQVLGRDADTAIFHRADGPPVPFLQGNPHPTARRGVLDRVGDEVAPHLGHLVGVSPDHRTGPDLYGPGEPFRLRLFLEERSHLFQHVRQGDQFPLLQPLLALRRRQFQQVVHQVQEFLHPLDGPPQHLLLLLRRDVSLENRP